MVVIVIGVLVSMALPHYSLTVEKMRSTEGIQTLTALLNGQKSYFLDNDAYADNIDRLDVEIPSSNFFDTPIVENDANRVATVVRSTGAYEFAIDENGVITCVDLSGDTCSHLGY